MVTQNRLLQIEWMTLVRQVSSVTGEDYAVSFIFRGFGQFELGDDIRQKRRIGLRRGLLDLSSARLRGRRSSPAGAPTPGTRRK